MKRFILILLCLWVTNVFALEVDDAPSKNDKIRIYSGFRFGFGGAKQRNTVLNRNDGQFVINPNMGAVLWIRFKQHVGIMAEANYSMKGIRFKNEVGDTLSIYQRRLHYVEFPVLLHASIGNQKFTEFIEVGLAPSYVSGVYDQTSQFVDGMVVSSESQEFIYNKPLPLPTSRFDLGVVMGAGMSVKIGPGLLHTGFRTTIGLLDVYKGENRVGYINQAQRQFNFQIQFGYLWHVKSIKDKNVQ